MPVCKACGTDVATGKKFCTECGSPMAMEAVTSVPTAALAQTGPSEPVFVPVQEPKPKTAAALPFPAPPPASEPKREPSRSQGSGRGSHSSFAFSDPDAEPPSYSKYAVVSTGDFLGVMLLMLIPVVNIILLIVWAFGGCKKVNKRSFARAALIMCAISTALGLIASLLVGSLFQGVMDQATAFF